MAPMILQLLVSTAILLLMAFVVLDFLFRGLILRMLTGRKYISRYMLRYEAWNEIWAELKARRLVAKLRRDGEF